MSTYTSNPAPRPVRRLDRPVDADVTVPGSKSITNRALVCAALAAGDTVLEGALFADDTEAMLSCLHELGIGLQLDRSAATIAVTGCGGALPHDGGLLDARMSGTTGRFVLPLLCLGDGTFVLDGAESLRARPMGDLIGALGRLGADIAPLGEDDRLPVQVDARGLLGGEVSVRGDASSQFLSGLLLSGPAMRRGLAIEVDGPLVSVPYVTMTIEVMRSFGATCSIEGTSRFDVSGGYTAPGHYRIEPDASAASYFLAAAALTGGRVRIDGLGSSSLQGDVGFAEALARMGADVTIAEEFVEVRGTGSLRGIDIDMSDISDTAQTLAVLAPFADGPTTITGIGFIRGKETDRIAAVVAELQRCGIVATELDDGIRVEPGQPVQASIRTYDDHRMAMSFAVLGLRADGIVIEDPGCVAKTFPDFWDVLATL